MNKQIVVSVLFIGGVGIVNAWITSKPVTPIIIGSYVLMLVLSIGDMFGGEFARLMGALALLAAGFVALTEVPWNLLIGLVQGKSKTTGTKPATPQQQGYYPPNQH